MLRAAFTLKKATPSPPERGHLVNAPARDVCLVIV
jgi:hypothetical protein